MGVEYEPFQEGSYEEGFICSGLATSLIAGCAYQAPYGTPEATSQLVSDLSLDGVPELIVPANWMSVPYGVTKPAEPTKGLLVSERSGLRLVIFDNKHYRQAGELRAPEVQCGYIWRGEQDTMPVHLFEAEHFYALSLGETIGAMDVKKRAQVVRYLQTQHIPLLTVQDGLFVRATGNWSSNVPLPNNYAPWDIGVPLPRGELEAFNPCKY